MPVTLIMDIFFQTREELTIWHAYSQEIKEENIYKGTANTHECMKLQAGTHIPTFIHTFI